MGMLGRNMMLRGCKPLSLREAQFDILQELETLFLLLHLDQKCMSACPSSPLMRLAPWLRHRMLLQLIQQAQRAFQRPEEPFP